MAFRNNISIYYYLTQQRHEVDFLIRDLKGRYKLIQVVWDMQNKETMEREERALKEAEKELGVKGEIITVESYLKDFLK